MKRTGFKQKSYAEKIETLKSKKPTIRKKRTVTKTKKKVKPKNKRVKTLKTKLWQVFARYIRKREANHQGYLTTSDGQLTHWENTDCGHLFHNSERNQQLGGNELWYYENNFYPQSRKGNRFNADDSAKTYTIWAIKRYGMEEVENMRRMKDISRKYTEEELQEKFEYYTREFNKL